MRPTQILALDSGRQLVAPIERRHHMAMPAPSLRATLMLLAARAPDGFVAMRPSRNSITYLHTKVPGQGKEFYTSRLRAAVPPWMQRPDYIRFVFEDSSKTWVRNGLPCVAITLWLMTSPAQGGAATRHAAPSVPRRTPNVL